MRFHFITVITGALVFCSASLAAQHPGTAGTNNAQPIVLDSGTLIYLELAKSVDAKKAKPGDEVNGVLLADVLSHGRIVFKADSKLLGHVVEARPHTKETPESRLGIVFDQIIPKGGGQPVAFHSVLLALHPAPQLQIQSISPPGPPGTMSTGQAEERHYPTPNGPRSPQMNPAMQGELNKHSETTEGLTTTDIEDLSLEGSTNDANRTVVSVKRTVKLESGVRIDLQITNAQPSKDPAHAP